MQLKLQRSQRMGGVLAGTVVFCLDVRADYTADERDNINKYKLGGQVDEPGPSVTDAEFVDVGEIRSRLRAGVKRSQVLGAHPGIKRFGVGKVTGTLVCEAPREGGEGRVAPFIHHRRS